MMYHPILVERLAEEHIISLRQSVQPKCASKQRKMLPGAREAVAHLLVKVGMFVHHNAGERAATHVHNAG